MTDFDKKVSIQSFQQCDGSNFSTAGVDFSKKFDKISLGSYLGFGTSYKKGSTGVVFDVKGSVPYGNSPVSGGFRVRNNITPNSKSVQLRLQPATLTIPLSDKTNLYSTPYVATKINYKNGSANTSFGNFSGISTKIGKVNMFVEGQLYDLTKINPSTTSVNLGFSVSF